MVMVFIVCMSGGWDENLLDRVNDYLDLVFDEEDFRCYFLIVENSWFEIKDLV